jgi:hypothetical protein
VVDAAVEMVVVVGSIVAAGSTVVVVVLVVVAVNIADKSYDHYASLLPIGAMGMLICFCDRHDSLDGLRQFLCYKTCLRGQIKTSCRLA